MGRYRRTVSFPNPSPSFRATGPATANSKSYHVRSASLPCARSNPLIPQLHDEINEFRAWERANIGCRVESGRVCDGLARLKGILDSLDDVLQLPQTQDALSSSTAVVEKLLEDFLRFVDVYGIFRASLLGLKQEISGAQVAIRRKDAAKLGLHVKAQKKIANEIGKLISAVGSAAEPPPAATATADHHIFDHDEDLRAVIRDAHRLTGSVSGGLFAGVSASFGPGRRGSWAGLGLGLTRWAKRPEEEGIEEFQEVVGGIESLMKKKGENNNNEEMRKMMLKRMQEMEDCIGEMERGSERVFRSLISTRVSLLNILTHA